MARVLSALALIGLVGGLAETEVFAGNASAFVVAPLLDDSTVVTLERGPCVGQCPEYTVVLYGSGRVEFEGRRYVCTKGHHTAKASVLEVRRLVAHMLAAGYFDLDWSEGPFTTLASTVTTSLRHAGRSRQIEHDLGDARAPRLLKRLEDRIDAVAGTWRWLPERGDPDREDPDRADYPRVCFKPDGTTEPLQARW